MSVKGSYMQNKHAFHAIHNVQSFILKYLYINLKATAQFTLQTYTKVFIHMADCAHSQHL